jgi:TetR/AcrR family transcriptional repressor of nem operon
MQTTRLTKESEYTMARPVEFDKDTVLTNAMEQFWLEGYEASSVQKLLDATDINRGTLYNSFGDKDTFFKSCVEKYNDVLKADITATLGNDRLGDWKAIEAYFETAIIAAPNKQRALGCLLVNSVCESINWDRDMHKVVKNSFGILRKAMATRVKALEKSRQLKRGLKADQAVEILMNLYNGLRVSARSGKGPKQLTELVSFTLGSLKK